MMCGVNVSIKAADIIIRWERLDVQIIEKVST